MKKVFKTRSKVEEDLMLLEVFFKQVLHHLIMLKEQHSEIIAAWFIIFLLKFLLRVHPIRANFVSYSNLLSTFIPIDASILWVLLLFYLFIHVLAACILKEPHSILTVALLLLIYVLRRFGYLCLNGYLYDKHSTLAQLRHNWDFSAHHPN